MTRLKVMLVVGARPNLMKAAALLRAFEARSREFHATLVHTGQHYDAQLNDTFFRDLGLPPPAVNLGVGSASHAEQTANVMLRFEPILARERPDVLVVVGDVNSTLACALVAAKLLVPVAHVEAGLRSSDRTMPEEINRILTDQISDFLFTTEPSGNLNLAREGIPVERVHLVGNVMIDTLRRCLPKAVPAAHTLRSAGLKPPASFALATIHRPSNVDEEAALSRTLSLLAEVAGRIPVVFPVHPRTRERIERYGFARLIDANRLTLLAPVGYFEMLGLLQGARFVLTDSGGIQEETTALRVPCITLRDSTERPITIDEGSNVLAGSDPGRVLGLVDEVLAGHAKRGQVPALWDGRAAERIVAILAQQVRCGR